jgi:hypothetical protein
MIGRFMGQDIPLVVYFLFLLLPDPGSLTCRSPIHGESKRVI